ncbi:MAG: ABC transporter permease [Porphyromonadaceae bacterium]|nr:ABC transporter permease [Porphyromonadaceae bacterium]
MIRLYLKQAWRLLRETPVLSTISILGTALAICMIMAMVMAYQVKNAPYGTEVNRDRTLYVKFTSCHLKGEDPNESSSNGCMSYPFALRCFKPLKTAEAVSIVMDFLPQVILSVPASRVSSSCSQLLTDEAFWQVFDFDFIAGKPYTLADVEAGLRRVVLSERIAREVFGTTDVVGRELLVSYVPYTVCGVVCEVSPLASSSYSELWRPITTDPQPEGWGGITGGCQAYILAHSSDDFEQIRAEVEELRQKFNDANPTHNAFYRGQPDTHLAYINRKWANQELDLAAKIRPTILTLLLLLLVPAINLSGMTNSRMRQRLVELGVRRAFGATRWQITSQVLWESLLQTIIGGAVGFCLAVASSYIFSDMIYSYGWGQSGMPDLLSLMSPLVFLYALLFCLLLNALSALIPAWRISRHGIIDALHAQ